MVFDVDADTDVLGRTIDIEVTLADAAGGAWRDVRRVVVVAP